MTKLSIIKNLHKVSTTEDLENIISEIRKGSEKVPILRIRELLRKGKKPEVESIKKKLSGFTPSGTFTDTRKGENLERYSIVKLL